MSSVVVVSADDSSTTLFPLPSGCSRGIRSLRFILGSNTVEITTSQASDHEHSPTNGFATMEIRIQAPTGGASPAPSASPLPSPPPSPLPGNTNVTELAPASTTSRRRRSSSRVSQRRASSFVASSSSDGDDDEEEEEGRGRKRRLRARRKKEYVKKMRGWLMVVATLVASAAFSSAVDSDRDDFVNDSSYVVFFISNTVAFGLSLGSIILLMGENTFHGRFKVQLLRVFVVGAIFSLAVSFCFACYGMLGLVIIFFVCLAAFLVGVTLLTWWYNKKRGKAVVWRLRSFRLGRLVRWGSNATETVEEDHNGRP